MYVVLCLIAFGCQYQCNWLPGKTRLRYDLSCVEWDVKPYTLSHSLTKSHIAPKWSTVNTVWQWYTHSYLNIISRKSGRSRPTISNQGYKVELWVGPRTCNSQVMGSDPGQAPLRSFPRQATFTCVPLSPSSVSWCWPADSDTLWLGRK